MLGTLSPSDPAGMPFPADPFGTLSLSEMNEIPVHYSGASADSYDPAFDDVGYVSSFDDWRYTAVPDDSGVLSPDDGEAVSPCPCSRDEVAMPARLQQDSLCFPDYLTDIDPGFPHYSGPIMCDSYGHLNAWGPLGISASLPHLVI